MAAKRSATSKPLTVRETPVRFELAELAEILTEANRQVEDQLALEDQGWIVGGRTANEIITDLARQEAVKASRLYWTKDPLAKQSIRLWTDYTFGTGMTWSTEDENARKILEAYWNNPNNQVVLSARGQRRSSDKALVEGEVYFALFLGEVCRVRLIDPLEITDIISDPDDRDDERYYKREWLDTSGTEHTDYYCSHWNKKDKPVKIADGKIIRATAVARNCVVYRLPFNTIGQRGMPLLLPALDWIKQYRRFLASRIAIMLALARFAWKSKVQGGATAISTQKHKLHEQEIKAGSMLLENLGSDTQPIRTDSNARNAYDDGRMLKLQIAAAVGIPEQYFGDISIGNLATAKTVELPMMKMFQSYQTIWKDAFKDMDEIVLERAGVDKDVVVTRVFPEIAPEDAVAVASALAAVIQAIPDLAEIDQVITVALRDLGIEDAADVLEKFHKAGAEQQDQVPPLPPEQAGQASQQGNQQHSLPPGVTEADVIRALRVLESILKQGKGGRKNERQVKSTIKN